jgi:hypothetical protein
MVWALHGVQFFWAKDLGKLFDARPLALLEQDRGDDLVNYFINLSSGKITACQWQSTQFRPHARAPGYTNYGHQRLPGS